MKKGFTLLELLIVVIIVGVLASLALPNFLRGVERARWAEAKSILGALRGAQIRYKAQYEAGYADNIDNLDLEITKTKHFDFTVYDNPNELAKATRKPEGMCQGSVSIDINGTLTYSGDANNVCEWVK